MECHRTACGTFGVIERLAFTGEPSAVASDGSESHVTVHHRQIAVSGRALPWAAVAVAHGGDGLTALGRGGVVVAGLARSLSLSESELRAISSTAAFICSGKRAAASGCEFVRWQERNDSH